MPTPTTLPTHSPASSIVKADLPTVELALRSRTIIQAFTQPTVAMALREVGERQLMITLTAAITQAMGDYFSAEQRMDPAMCSSFAETIIEAYPHEAVGDVVVFIKLAARGKYGKKNVKEFPDGRKQVWYSEHGQTYGRLTYMRLMEWWEQYLIEKADALAEARERGNKELNGTRLEPPLTADSALVGIMKKVRKEEPGPDNEVGRRIDRLLRTVSHMGDDRLRYSYVHAKTRREQIVILQEANYRGLVQKKIEDHLKQQEQP